MEKEEFFKKILPEPPNGGNGKKEDFPQSPQRGGEKTSGAAFSAPDFLERLRCPAARTGILRGFL